MTPETNNPTHRAAQETRANESASQIFIQVGLNQHQGMHVTAAKFLQGGVGFQQQLPIFSMPFPGATSPSPCLHLNASTRWQVVQSNNFPHGRLNEPFQKKILSLLTRLRDHLEHRKVDHLEHRIT